MNTENKPLFRFKTREEFLEEFGDRWEDVIVHTWAEEMNKYLGQCIGANYNINFLKLYIYDENTVLYNHWSISRDMIKPIINEQ